MRVEHHVGAPAEKKGHLASREPVSTQEFIAKALPGARRWRRVLLIGLGAVVVVIASISLGHVVGGWFTSSSSGPRGQQELEGAEDPAGLAAAARDAAPRSDARHGPDAEVAAGQGPSLMDVSSAPAARTETRARPERAARARSRKPRSRRSAAGLRTSPARRRKADAQGGGGAASVSPAQRAGELRKEAMELMHRRDLPGAMKKLQEATKLAPRMAKLHRDMGRIAMRSRRKDAAIRHFETYLRLAPKAPDAATYRTIIDDLAR